MLRIPMRPAVLLAPFSFSFVYVALAFWWCVGCLFRTVQPGMLVAYLVRQSMMEIIRTWKYGCLFTEISMCCGE